MRIDRVELRGRLQASFPGRCLGTFFELQGLDRAMAIAAQAFTALIPLLLLTSAVVPLTSHDVVVNAIIGRFRLTGDSAHDVRVLFEHSGAASTGVFSVLLLLFSGISLTRRLQRMYLQAWRLDLRPGLRGSLNAALGLATLLVEIMLLYGVRSVLRSLPFPGALSWLVSSAAGVVLWTSVPWLLLDRRLAWRRLLPLGALTALLAAGYGVATTVYMPRLMESYSDRYGVFGVTLALVGWLLCISVVVVVATVLTAEFDRAPEPWARRLRDLVRVDEEDTAEVPAAAGAPHRRSPAAAVKGSPDS